MLVAERIACNDERAAKTADVALAQGGAVGVDTQAAEGAAGVPEPIGAVLVFLPGYAEIDAAMRVLRRRARGGGRAAGTADGKGGGGGKGGKSASRGRGDKRGNGRSMSHGRGGRGRRSRGRGGARGAGHDDSDGDGEDEADSARVLAEAPAPARTSGPPPLARAWLLPLHASLPVAQQRRVFARPPDGQVKVILSTNIAETSITIDDVDTVVDAGHSKELRHDTQSSLSTLATVWVSHASAEQRAGRAGRVRAGSCYHLYEREFLEHALPKQPLAEMLRTPLEELVLQVLLLRLGAGGENEQRALGPRALLARAPEPPTAKAICAAVRNLEEIGALMSVAAAPAGPVTTLPDDGASSDGKGGDADEGAAHAAELSKEDAEDALYVLTPLGQHLARLPLDPRLGKLLVLGAALRCVEPALTVAAALAHRSPFAAKFGDAGRAAEAAAKARLGGGARSDQLAAAAAFDGWRAAWRAGGNAAARAYCEDNSLAATALESMYALRHQLRRALTDAGFLVRRAADSDDGGGDDNESSRNEANATDLSNANGANLELVKCVLAAALYPQIARLSKPKPSAPGVHTRGLLLSTRTDDRVSVHPSSVNFHLVGAVAAAASKTSGADAWLCYHAKLKTSQVFVRDVTFVPPLALLLFCGGGLTIARAKAPPPDTAAMRGGARARRAALLEARAAAARAKGECAVIVDEWIAFRTTEVRVERPLANDMPAPSCSTCSETRAHRPPTVIHRRRPCSSNCCGVKSTRFFSR